MGVTRGTGVEAADAAVIAASVVAPERFAAIFDRHFDAIHAYLARRVGGHRADDLAAATFEVAFQRRRSFREFADTARPWLFGIATNLMRAESRAERQALAALPALVPAQAFSEDRPAGGAGADVDDAALARGLAGLDPDQRDVLLLHAWEELSYEEIAIALGVPVGTVRSRLSRARARIRQEMER